MKKTTIDHILSEQDELNIPGTARAEDIDKLPHTPFWSTLWMFARLYRRQLLTAFVCSMVVGVAVPLQMQFCVKWIIDSVLGESGNGEMLADERMRRALLFIGLFIVLSITRVVVWIIGYRRMLASIEGILCRVRAHFFRHVQRMSLRFHDQISSGELFNYIMGSPTQSIKQFLQQFCMVVPYQAVGWVFSVGLLASFNWRMTAITIVVVVTVVILNRRSRVIVRGVAADYMKTESTASRFIADMLRGSRAVKTYAMEDEVNDIFAYQIVRVRDEGYRLAVRQQLERIKPEIVQYAGLALVLASGTYFVVYGDMTAGTFTAFILSFNMLMQPLMQIMQLNLIRGNAESGLDRIMRVMQIGMDTKELPPQEQVNVEQQAVRLAGRPQAGIVFEQVEFSYNGDTPILHNLSCRIREGESVALVGPSGSGKTTFVSLLLRFYDPVAGRILLNELDLRRYGLRPLRSQFGVVPQDPFIFQATLRDNIRVTNPEASPEEIETAIETACMGEYVEGLPNGLDTWLGEGGSNISGGQKQRLAIARAILAKPRYYILDEATSALDNVSERRIQAAMENLMARHTAIIIAHRLSTIRNVDRIFVFGKGMIVESGTYQELAKRGGAFTQLLNSAEDRLIS